MLYLYLFHGRLDPKADMNEWGQTGPIFKTYRYAHTTYANDIKLDGPDTKFRQLIIDDNGLIYYDGVYYGDWSITTEIPNGHEVIEFDQAKAEKPPKCIKYQEVVQWFLEANDIDITRLMAEIVQETNECENDYQAFVEAVHEGLNQV